ncbi:hypothetical protein [Rhizomonospora bruguierae]|uniref:hypothetical protein n=1 Tax=Rhizomonospora bruguierae TaxID=1581705 RepID=UPI001BCBBF76|nr:hypothetical protein [Micromonospora sp. NBRC 107566]
MTLTRTAAALALAAALIVAAGGCDAQPDRPSQGGRVDPNPTSTADGRYWTLPTTTTEMAL